MPPGHAARQKQQWDGRAHFFAAAAEAMRRILVEGARRKRRLKHGANLHRRSTAGLDVAVEVPPVDVLAVDESLEKLAEVDAQAAQVVKLHFFGGMTLDEVAAALDISSHTAERDWAFARTWLARILRKANDGASHMLILQKTLAGFSSCRRIEDEGLLEALRHDNSDFRD